MTQLDQALIASIQKLTAFVGLRYTQRQLYYEVCRTLYPTPGLGKRHAGWALGLGLLPALLIWIIFRRPRWAGILAGINVVVVGSLYGMRRVPYTLSPPVPYDRFANALNNYKLRYGPPPGLLAERPVSISIADREPDLLDYGIPRLLVCQNSDIVHMLLMNDFHIELACPVLTLADASPLPDPLLAMLKRVPDAQVYFLHDAGLEGLSLVPELRQQMALPPEISLTIMGLRPDHARRMHLFTTQNPSLPEETPDWPLYLSECERSWVEAGWQTEVEAVSPVRLLRVLRRLMLGATKPRFKWPSLNEERKVGFMTWPEQ